MKKILFIVIEFSVLILLLSSFSACESGDDCHKNIAIQNNSINAIYVNYSDAYPDTTDFKDLPNPSLSPELHKVDAGEVSKRALWSRNCFEADIRKPLMIYVYDAQVLETTSWDTVIAQDLYLKRYDLTLQDVKDKNWIVSFP